MCVFVVAVVVVIITAATTVWRCDSAYLPIGRHTTKFEPHSFILCFLSW